jgi:hypothetical protein
MRTIPQEYINFNQRNSGSCWLIRPLQSLNIFLSHALQRPVRVSLEYIYLMNLKETVNQRIEFRIKRKVNGGGDYRDFKKIANRKIYEESELDFKVNIFDPKITSYLFKGLNRIIKDSFDSGDKEAFINEANLWIDSLFSIKYENKDFRYAGKYLTEVFFNDYFQEENIFESHFNKDFKFIKPYNRENGPFVKNDNFDKELLQLKILSNKKDPPKNINLPYMKDIRKSKKVYEQITTAIKFIEETIDKGDIPLISFLYSREQRHQMINGFAHVYARHLAMIEGYDDEHFIIRDSRENKAGDFFFRINKDKLIFLSDGLDVFYLSKLKE